MSLPTVFSRDVTDSGPDAADRRSSVTNLPKRTPILSAFGFSQRFLGFSCTNWFSQQIRLLQDDGLRCLPPTRPSVSAPALDFRQAFRVRAEPRPTRCVVFLRKFCSRSGDRFCWPPPLGSGHLAITFPFEVFDLSALRSAIATWVSDFTRLPLISIRRRRLPLSPSRKAVAFFFLPASSINSGLDAEPIAATRVLDSKLQ